MTGVGASPVDLDAVLARLHGDRALLIELAALYLEDEPGLIRRLETAVQQGEPEGVRRAAHTIEGSVSNFAAARAQDAALALEQAGRAGNLSAAAALLSTLLAELAAVREALAGLAAEHRTP